MGLLLLGLTACNSSAPPPVTPEAAELRRAARAVALSKGFVFGGTVERRPRSPAVGLQRFLGIYQAPDRTQLAEVDASERIRSVIFFVGRRSYTPTQSGYQCQEVRQEYPGTNSVNVLKAVEQAEKVTKQNEIFLFTVRPGAAKLALGAPPEGGRYTMTGKGVVKDGMLISLHFEAKGRKTALFGDVNYAQIGNAPPVNPPDVPCRALKK